MVYLWHSLQNFLFIDEESLAECKDQCLFVTQWKEPSDYCAKLAGNAFRFSCEEEKNVCFLILLFL